MSALSALAVLSVLSASASLGCYLPPMRLATFNAENLFSRPKAMLGLTLAEGRQVLADFAELSGLIEEPTYSTAIKNRLRTLVNRNLYGPTPSGGRKIRLNEVRNKLVRRTGTTTTIVPAGRAEWVGWFELRRHQVHGGTILRRQLHRPRPAQHRP